jgi:hypothetical protein
MIVQSHVTFPFMGQLYHERLGAGEDKLVMDGGREDISGPVMLLLPDKPLHFNIQGIYHVTQAGENISERILYIPSDVPRVIWWIDEVGRRFCLRLWHFKLKVPW